MSDGDKAEQQVVPVLAYDTPPVRVRTSWLSRQSTFSLYITGSLAGAVPLMPKADADDALCGVLFGIPLFALMAAGVAQGVWSFRADARRTTDRTARAGWASLILLATPAACYAANRFAGIGRHVSDDDVWQLSPARFWLGWAVFAGAGLLLGLRGRLPARPVPRIWHAVAGFAVGPYMWATAPGVAMICKGLRGVDTAWPVAACAVPIAYGLVVGLLLDKPARVTQVDGISTTLEPS